MGEPKKNLITKSNSLIEANYKLGELEQKIIWLLASRIQPSDKEFKTYTLRIKEFTDLLGLTSKSKYSEIEQITLGLMQKVFQIKTEYKTEQISWLSYVAYNKKSGTVDLRIDPSLKPFLIELKECFTSYRIENILQLKGQYTIRIYEMLKQYEKIKERTFKVDEIKEKLCVGDMYPQYGSFKQRVLKPAQKELKKKTDISFELEEIKTGRKVDTVKFIIKKNKNSMKSHQLSLFEGQKDEDIKHSLQKHGIQVSDATLNKWAEYDKERVIEVINYTSEQDNIHNPIGLITYLLENEWRPEVNVESKDSPVTKEMKRFQEELVNSTLPYYLMENDFLEQLTQNLDVSKDEAASLLNEYKDMFSADVISELKKKRKKKSWR
ncbi:hypothetical protein AWM68_17305 [Fictibacillus phosphorivorans]|uniref:Initiator Rep protein WH1 domain-containing protein n=1 Tax=Fictibacillus phosphorivorans TaxID=1221500 RepID=A0A161TPI5_9BACL|nr:replication initiation protein [Fictibacillus phosphorivorans]KZE67931.1 hypothetical protein AWM68_17305 [Fictibacillus phosphorivorans]